MIERLYCSPVNRKRTISSAAGDAEERFICPAVGPATGTTDDAVILPRKKKKMLVAPSNEGWGDFFRSRNNFVLMHIR